MRKNSVVSLLKLAVIMRLIPVLILPLLLTGCVAAVGAAAASGEENEDIDYYLKTNEVQTRIEKAMRDRKIASGMTPAQVKLVMGAKNNYKARPDSVKNFDGGEEWMFESIDPMMPATYKITFNKGVVVGKSEE